MNLENQVVDQELSIKINKLGFKQESHFYWVQFSEEGSRKKTWELVDSSEFTKENSKHYNAYSVAELGEMLPMQSSTHKNFKDAWVCEVKDLEDYQVGKTEANARAKMLIYLKENKLI